MQDENTPRRRRVRQMVPEEMMGETPPPAQEAPKKIVISADDETPDWMVSAGKVSGAASRRTRHAAAEPQKTDPVRKDTSEAVSQVQEINRLRKGSVMPATPLNDARPEEAAPAPVQRKVKKAQVRPAAGKPGARKPAAPKPQPVKKKLSKKAKARRAKKIRQGVAALLALAVVISLIVIGAIGGSRLIDIKQTLDQGDGVFYPNIYVNSIPLAGKTLDEAAALVSQQIDALVSSWRIALRTQDGRSWDITGEDLKMKYDVADQLDQLWAIGHTGSSSARYEQVKALEEEPIMRYTTLSYDMSAINQILTQIKAEVDRAPVSANKYYDETKWPPYSYTDDTPGQELDITGLNERIMGMVDKLESGVVDLAPTPVEAPVTRAYLESQIVQLATYETTIGNTSTEGRFANIKLGTEKFNHLTIKSGESVSFNKVTGKRVESNGYQQALELAYGEYVMGWGGGICQVSSTLYNCVVNAGLEIKERTQHSLPSSYVDKGLDATVQDGRIDFVFKNSTSADIFIESEYYKKGAYYRCKFTIWGRPDPNGYSYKLVSEVVDTIEIPEVKFRPDEEMKYVVYDDETYVASKGEEGYIVDVYRVTMDRSGLEVAREKVYTDTYKAVAPVTYVGVMPRETPVPSATPGSID